MTLEDLIERLEDLKEEFGGEVEVKGVFQPNYPLLARLIAVTTVTRGDKAEIFLGLSEGREYGSGLHYDDCITEAYDEEDGE